MRRKKPKMPVYYAKDGRGRVIKIPIREERPGYFRVDSRVRGRGQRKCFSDLTAAENHARSLALAERNEGMAAFLLSDAQRHDALKALAILAGSASLEASAVEYVRRHPARGAEKLVSTAARYIRQMRREGARRISIKDKLWKFRAFCKGMGKDAVTAAIETPDVERWMDVRGYTSRETRRSYRVAVNCLLNFYHGRRKNHEHRDEVLPTIWRARDVERLMRTAAKEAPESVPALAVMFFAGLRPYEVFRLNWSRVNLTDGFITVTPESSKVRSARTVEISDNLRQWIAPHYRDSGMLSGGQYVFRRLREKVMEKAGISDWPTDVARHTFATAHYWHHQDAARTMKELGHFGSVQTFVRHYKSLMTPSEAAAFWEIKPAAGKVIHLRRDAVA